MIHVRQTETYQGGTDRGNCYAACVASLFEVPIESLPEFRPKFDAALNEWLAIHYPGVIVRSRAVEPFDADERWPKGIYPPQGYWMATVESPRFQEECTEHTVEGGTPRPPHWYNLADCPHCRGSGTRQGYHLVVARAGEVAHDPHPEVGGSGWEYNGRLVEMTWFEVTDPGRLLPRARPLL